MDYPTFVRIEYWNPDKAEWKTGHAGINLMNPQRYVTMLGKSRPDKPGTIARAIDTDTDQVVYSEGADLL